MFKDNSKSLKMPMIALDITNKCCQSTLKCVMHGFLGIITQGKLHKNWSNIVCHKLLSSLGNNKNWHIHFFAVVDCGQKHSSIFFQQHNFNFTTNFLETNCPVHKSWKESLNISWGKAGRITAQITAIIFSLKIHFISTYDHGHTLQRKEGTMSFLMTTALVSGTWRHSKEFCPLVDCDLEFQKL